jgi:hypothetical protein
MMLMRTQVNRALVILGLLAAVSTSTVGAAGIDKALQARIDSRLPAIRSLAADPDVVAAVKVINASAPPEYASMTQAKWARLSVLDPFVRAFTRNAAALALKAKKAEDVSEMFVSSADGLKVAFISKTTNWSHKGKPKHEVPMTGRTWQGPIESTGIQQIQVAVPVLDGGKPIGSLVVGLAVSRLRSDQ